MTDERERAGHHDPLDPITPGFPAPGGITGGAVPPAEPIPHAADPFSPTGGPTTPAPGEPSAGGPADPPSNRAWWWALGGLVLFGILAVTIWLMTRGGTDEGAPPVPTVSVVSVVSTVSSSGTAADQAAAVTA